VSPQLQRGLLLLDQGRPGPAEAEIRRALALDPAAPLAHACLALCLAAQKKYAGAGEAAGQAVHLGPDLPFSHYVLARVAYDRDRYGDALAAITEAIRLDPADADQFALLAGIHFDERRWPDALHAAEQGLEVDAEHVGCGNLRAMALVKLGRTAEAGLTIDRTLAKAPENALTHANQGWTLLHRGDHAKALDHFREALRLDPENEWARQGIVEALKARHAIYAVMLRYFLWMSRFSQRAQWTIVLGGYIGYRLLGSIARTQPGLGPWLLPFQILYVVFALMTWLAQPLFNLLLRLNRFGRLALSPEQTATSNWVGSALALALIFLAGFVAAALAGTKTLAPACLLAALVSGALALPLSAINNCSEGWPRRTMAGYTALLSLAGLAAVFILFASALSGEPVVMKAAVATASGPLSVFFVGVFLNGFLANFLMMQRPAR
jgi:tetratricopeptide (TPR) repeat protein